MGRVPARGLGCEALPRPVVMWLVSMHSFVRNALACLSRGVLAVAVPSMQSVGLRLAAGLLLCTRCAHTSCIQSHIKFALVNCMGQFVW